MHIFKLVSYEKTVETRFCPTTSLFFLAQQKLVTVDYVWNSYLAENVLKNINYPGLQKFATNYRRLLQTGE